MTDLSKVMDIFSDILSKRRTKGQQDKGLDAQVEARPRWAIPSLSEQISNPAYKGKPYDSTPRPVGKDDPRGQDYGERTDPEGLVAPSDSGLANPNVPAKYVTWNAIDRHQKREAMRRERELESQANNPNHRITPSPKDRKQAKENRRYYEEAGGHRWEGEGIYDMQKALTIFSDILSKTTDAPDEDSYKKAKAKTNGHGKDSASRLYGKDQEPYQELHYNPSRDESLSPSDKARKAAWMRQRSEDYFKDKFSQHMQKRGPIDKITGGRFRFETDPKKVPEPFRSQASRFNPVPISTGPAGAWQHKVNRAMGAIDPVAGQVRSVTDKKKKSEKRPKQPNLGQTVGRHAKKAGGKVLDYFVGEMEKSRFEQQPVKGNFIPRPDPKKNTTEENEDETSVILAKESPIQGPGIPPKYSQPSKEAVGKGKKASQEIISEGAKADDSTYVMGMEKASTYDEPDDKPKSIAEQNVERLNYLREDAEAYDADRYKAERAVTPPHIWDELVRYGQSRGTHLYDSDEAMRSDPTLKPLLDRARREGKSEADVDRMATQNIQAKKNNQRNLAVHQLRERYPRANKPYDTLLNFYKTFGIRKADKGKVLPFESEGDKEKRESGERLMNELSPSRNPSLRAHFETHPQDLERYNETIKRALHAAKGALEAVRGANKPLTSDPKKNKPASENPTKPRWGGEGIGQHMEKAKGNNIYAIATAAAKGDEDKKEKIVLALKRGKMILKLLKAAERRTKRQKKADQEAGLDRRLEGVGITTTPTTDAPAGEIDARTTQRRGLIKPADAMSVGHSAEAMSDKANKAFERRMYELRRQKGDIVGTLEWHKRKREEPDDPEAVVTEADLMLPKERRKRELGYNETERKFFRQHRPLYTGQAQNKHIKRRLLNIAEANRDAGRTQLPEDPEGNRPGYSSSPYDYLQYPDVKEQLKIIRNRAYNQGTGKWKREDEGLPW